MWTVSDHLHGKPTQVVQLFDRFMAAVQACGPVDVQTLQRQAVLHGRRRIFASVRPTAEGLRGHLNLPRPVDDPRFTAVEPLTKRLFFHRFTLSSVAKLDEEFVGWIRESYAVRQGAHLRQPRPQPSS
jgi:hypothetical protein